MCRYMRLPIAFRDNQQISLADSTSCTCCTLVKASAECCRYLCYPSAVMRQWPLWSNPVPLSLIRCTYVVPLFLRCCVICHMVLIAQCGKVLRLPLRSYRLYNRISQFWFDRELESRNTATVPDPIRRGNWGRGHIKWSGGRHRVCGGPTAGQA